MALTADTKVQRMPSESAAQSLAVALPASQSRYCCISSLTLLLSMGRHNISYGKTKHKSRAALSILSALIYKTFKETPCSVVSPGIFFLYTFFLGCHKRQWAEVGTREILFR